MAEKEKRKTMDATLYMVLPFIGGLLLYQLIRQSTLQRGRNLQAKFRALGKLAGRTRSEIIQTVGLPTSVSGITDGKYCCNGSSLVITSLLGFRDRIATPYARVFTHESAVR